ncbi:MAG: zinc-dependent metalloprotease [Myxococcota bacterium]
MKSAYLHSLLLAAVLAMFAGCAQDLAEIDTVQPNYVKKADLLGREWYLRTTVVATTYTSAYTFPGEMGTLTRGVFEIQEDALYFYRTYEFMLGSDAYAMKGDTDVPLLDKNGKPVTHAVPQDYQKVACATDADCGVKAWCGNAAAPKAKDEADWNGFCVREGRQYVFRGAPVLAFPISSHFDITYAYSSASGEKTNRRYENTSDRKWFDREFMRVQWGSQQLVDFDGDVTGGILASASVAPVVYEGDTAPEGEEFELCADGKKCKQAYMTYVHRLIASAPTVYYDAELGNIPICYFYPWYTGGVYDCASEEVKVRTFFLEVPDYTDDPTKAYVSREQDDVEFEKFGYFRTERPVYDIEFGVTYNNAVRRAQRHRIWDRYVKCYVDPTAAPGENCKGPGEGRVWKGDFDYTKMTPEPIVYYLNTDHPRELVVAARNIARGWSEPLEAVVAFHKAGVKPDHPMFILCENSDAAARAALKAGQQTAEYSDTAIGKRFCKDMDKPHRFGDLRYNYMHAVPANIQIGLYGYGPSAADPITGEIIAASAHAYVSQMKLGSEGALQAIELQAGVKDFNDVKYATEKLFNITARRFKTYDQKSPKSTEELRTHLANMMDPDVRQRLETAGLNVADNGGSYAQSRMARIQQNPSLDEMLVGNDPSYSVHALFKDLHVKPGTTQQMTADQLQKLSVANWAHIAGLRERRKVFDKLATKTLHFDSFTDNAIIGVAQEYGRRYDEALCKAYAAATVQTLYNGLTASATGETCTTPLAFESQGLSKGRICVTTGTENRWADCSSPVLMEQLRVALNTANGNNPILDVVHMLPSPLYTDTMDPLLRNTQEVGRAVVTPLRAQIKGELWAKIYKATQDHEIGHTLGLRHNFEASTDALNYQKKYWDLKVNAAGDVIHPWSDETATQAEGDMRTQQMASIMDYGAKFNSDFAGLGMYDRAAIKFGYGDIVESFTNPPDLTTSPGGELAPLNDYLATPTQDNPSTNMLLHQGNQAMNKILRRIHYSTLPKYFGSVANLHARKDVAWSSLKGDRCVSDDQCGQNKVCRLFGEDKYCADSTIVEVPYRFCSDELNGETPTCATFDEGADPYEIARNALNDYEQYWYFWGYARDSEMFHPDNYSARVENAFYTAVRQFQFWAIDFATYQKDGWWKKRYGREFDQDVNGGLSGAYATVNTFNKLAQVIARPAPGYYCWNAKRNRFEPYNQFDSSGCPDDHWFDETNGGRQLYAGWGGGYMYRPITAGQIYDRIAAFSLMSDPTTPAFVAVNEQEDLRRYMVSFYNVFPREMIQLFGGISIEDAEYYGWHVLQGPPDPATGNETKEFDYLLPRVWVGADADKQYKKCSDLPVTASPEQKTGCLKYTIFPDERPIFPSSRFRMPLFGAYFGMALLTQGFDRTFMDLSRVFLKGNEAAIDLPEGLEVAQFTDPLSGKVYVAAKTSDDTLNPGYMAVKLAAAELAKFPNIETLQQSYLFSEYQFRVSLLDLIRSMHETYEY